MRPQCNKVFALWEIGQRVIASRAAEATLRLSRGGPANGPNTGKRLAVMMDLLAQRPQAIVTSTEHSDFNDSTILGGQG